jgi:hypothetical protein
MGKDVTREIRKIAARGVRAAAIHATRRLKEVLSEPAPRRRVLRYKRIRLQVGRKIVERVVPIIEYVATVKATRGAYPRKLSGHLRRSITYEYVESRYEQMARVGTNVKYGLYLELSRGRGDHDWLVVTIQMISRELAYIMGGARSTGISGLKSEDFD